MQESRRTRWEGDTLSLERVLQREGSWEEDTLSRERLRALAEDRRESTRPSFRDRTRCAEDSRTLAG